MQAHLQERRKGLVLWLLGVAVSWLALSFLCGGNWLAAGAITLLSGSLALTPPGEAVWLWLLRARRPSRREAERIEEARNILCEAGVDVSRRLAWRIIDDPLPNAYAFMRHIVLTRGALEVFAPEELAGVLAHELAHVVEGDAARAQFVWGCSVITLALMVLWSVYATITRVVARVFGGVDHASASWAELLAVLMAVFLLGLKAILWVSGAFLAGGGRAMEYAADAWAAGHGFGVQLAAALQHLPEYVQPEEGRSWLAVAMASHPPRELRVDRILELVEAKTAD